MGYRYSHRRKEAKVGSDETTSGFDPHDKPAEEDQVEVPEGTPGTPIDEDDDGDEQDAEVAAEAIDAADDAEPDGQPG
jgi:hypothetical protein